jgi:hypothetical protein
MCDGEERGGETEKHDIYLSTEYTFYIHSFIQVIRITQLTQMTYTMGRPIDPETKNPNLESVLTH